ncbi:hypothetical protein B0H11DRAFT_1631032, partial [Mycena galericulata]
LNFVIYPWLRKMRINFSPVRRIVSGFLVAALAMAIGTIIQWKIYVTSPCGYYASDCSTGTRVSPISVWVQIPLYALPALAEVLCTFPGSYEVAYTRAPQRKKGVVFAIVLSMTALSSATTPIVSPSFLDPNLIWPFVGFAAALVISAI